MKTILVTGGTGFIGSHFVVDTIKNGYKTIVLDNLSNSSIDVLDNIEKITGEKPVFYKMDLRKKEDLKKVFLENKFDLVVHFAGVKAVGESIEKSFYYYENNIIGSLNLFETMNEFGVKNIIFSSSATVYKSSEKPPFGEETQVGNTSNPYGTTKFIIENILRDLSRYSGFKVVNFRYFNPIGAHKSGLLGENPDGIPNNLLPFIMKIVSGELKELEIFGNDYNTPDGTGVRDYIHILDLIDGHIKGINFFERNLEKKGFFETFNLGTGKGTSVLEMVNLTSKIIGKNLSYKIGKKRSGDLPCVFCNPQKAKEILGWQAKYTSKDAIKDSLNFINKNFKK